MSWLIISRCLSTEKHIKKKTKASVCRFEGHRSGFSHLKDVWPSLIQKSSVLKQLDGEFHMFHVLLWSKTLGGGPKRVYPPYQQRRYSEIHAGGNSSGPPSSFWLPSRGSTRATPPSNAFIHSIQLLPKSDLSNSFISLVCRNDYFFLHFVFGEGRGRAVTPPTCRQAPSASAERSQAAIMAI